LNKLKTTRNLIFLALILAAPNWGHSASKLKHQKVDDQRPTWTSYRSGTYQQETLVFYGVGKAKDIPNKALLRLTAYNRARTNLVHVVEIFVAKIMKAYMTALEQKKPGVSMEEQLVGPMLRSMLDTAGLKNIQPDRFWIDPADKTGYALASLKLEDYLKRFAAKKEFTPEFHSYVLNHAEQIFLEMTKE
jgi:hypothetical protein